jgi:hypothetical protein
MTIQPELKRVSPGALAEFKKFQPNIIKLIVERSIEHKEDVAQHGDRAAEILTSGLEFTTKALETSMQLHNVDLLEYQLQWAWDRLPHDNVQAKHLVSRFKIMAGVIEETLTPQNAAEVNQFVTWLIERQNELIEEKRV